MDRRRSKPEVLVELRQRAVALKKQGKTHGEIAAILDIGESTSRLYWTRYKRQGEEGLRLGNRGRPKGEGRMLSARQEKAVQKVITDKTPDQLKMPFALWTRAAIRQLVFERYGIKLAVRTLGSYLQRWGFTPQKPKKRDYEQQPEAVKQWLDHEYPAIAARAQAEGAQIFWGDETGVNNQDQIGRSYAPKGKTPTRRAMAKKVSTSMISAVTNKGQLRFMIYRKGMTSKLFIVFLKRLVKSTDQKVFLIVDNLRAHKAKAVQEWLDGKQDQIEVHYLPAYSPDLNPDEFLNNTIKRQLANLPPAQSVREQQERLRSQMRSNQKQPGLIASFFRAPSVCYAQCASI